MTDRDPDIGAVLDDLQPPPHRPDFWSDLDMKLAEIGPLADPGAEPDRHEQADDLVAPPVVPLTGAGIEQRRDRRRALVLSGLVAAVLVLVVAVTYGIDRLDRDAVDDRAVATEGSPSSDATAGGDGADPFDIPTTTFVDRPVPDEDLALVENLVLQFLEAIAAGDVDAAAAFVGPVSEQRADEELGGLDALLREAAEGLGAWTAAEGRGVSSVGLEAGLVVVVLEGDLVVEGMPEHRVTALPVRRTESPDRDHFDVPGGWAVEPWADDVESPIVEITTPDIDEEERAVVPFGSIEIEYQVVPRPDGEEVTTWESIDGDAYPPVVVSRPMPIRSVNGAMDDRSVLAFVAWEQGDVVGASAFRIDRPG
ncbi:MAG: hypothetical protein S0880_21425 [Actinomycetota bacterium]|nr:hypothetical protein [Actinomycetota bacterium]